MFFKMKASLILVLALAAATVSGFRTGSFTPLALDGRIVGGENANEREFPHQISLQAGPPGQTRHRCGGAIYDSIHILTAAHCVKDFDPALLEVWAGKLDLSVTEGMEQKRRVANTTFHPSYNDGNFDFDIGVITLEEPLTFTAFVQPVRIALETIEPSGEVVNTGWGNIRDDGSTEMPSILQKVTLNVVDRATCTQNYDAINEITQNMVCATDIGKGACSGDSGGPLIARDEARREYLAGLVSWGVIPCGQTGYPTVYANVAKLRPWLESVLNL